MRRSSSSLRSASSSARDHAPLCSEHPVIAQHRQFPRLGVGGQVQQENEVSIPDCPGSEILNLFGCSCFHSAEQFLDAGFRVRRMLRSRRKLHNL
jgi:hypothetical protein